MFLAVSGLHWFQNVSKGKLFDGTLSWYFRHNLSAFCERHNDQRSMQRQCRVWWKCFRPVPLSPHPQWPRSLGLRWPRESPVDLLKPGLWNKSSGERDQVSSMIQRKPVEKASCKLKSESYSECVEYVWMVSWRIECDFSLQNFSAEGISRNRLKIAILFVLCLNWRVFMVDVAL